VTGAADTPSELGEAGQQLLRRAPAGYLWNQAGALWLFVSLLLFEVVVRRSLPKAETNVFDLVSTAANLGFYLASVGLAAAGTVYLPRVLAEGGTGRAWRLVVRLVLVRLAMAFLVCAVMLWGLPALASAVEGGGWPAGVQIARGFTAQAILQHRAAIAAYVAAVGTSTLLSSLLIALIYTRVVFVFGSLGQLLLLGLAYMFIREIGGGVDGAIWAQVAAATATALVFAVALFRVLRSRVGARGRTLFGPALRLGIASWLADLPNSSLVQPVALGQLAAAAPGELLFFKSTYQMGDAGARFFTDGLGGVSLSVMSASYTGERLPALAAGWRTVSKLQVLLAVPLVAFAIPHASAIMALLFGPLYAESGGLLAVFLALNGLIQLLGGSTHEWALYVLGRQRWVVLSRWSTLGIVAVTGALLVPRYFALGALVAVGVGRLAAQLLLLALARRWVRRAYPAAYCAKVLAALVAPLVATALWDPAGFAAGAIARMRWLPGAADFPAQHALASALALALAGAAYLALFLAGLCVIRPLDAEDVALLGQAPPWLRRVLLPFAATPRRRADG
jgi:O-antigen/teichoic acid export membrane protein